MYVKSAALGGLGGGTAATLPFTGLNIVWYLMAAFTLIAAGLALLRLVPKHRRDREAARDRTDEHDPVR